MGRRFSSAGGWMLRKSENLLRVLSATSGGYNSLCFSASQPYSYAGSASARVSRPLSPTRLQKRYAISSPFSSFVVVPGGDHELLVAQRDERVDVSGASRGNHASGHAYEYDDCHDHSERPRIRGRNTG